MSIKVGSSTVQEINQEILLCVLIDNRHTFEEHISNLCQKVSNKLYALSRISHLMDQNKLRVLTRAFINSQFQYFPLTWMFHSRERNYKINKFHERTLRITYRDNNSSFESLLEEDASRTNHVKNLKVMLTEMFKPKKRSNSKTFFLLIAKHLFSLSLYSELRSCCRPCVLSAISTASSAYRMLLIGEPLILIFSVDTILRMIFSA